MEIDFANPPVNIKLRKHVAQKYYFAYPDGGLFAEFTHPDGTDLLRLVMEYEGVLFRIDLEEMLNKQSAREMAQKLYESSPPYAENIPPALMSLENIEAWRQRRLFIEGGREMMLIDTAFIQAKNSLYRLQFASPPDDHEKGQWIFDTVLHTLHFAG